MEVCDQTLADIGETRICTLGIDADDVLADVVDGQVLHWRYLDF